MSKIIRLTESDLVKLVNRVIKEQGGARDPKRIAFFDNLAKQIATKIVGKKLFFGNIGALKNNSLLVQKYVDRNHRINQAGSTVDEFSLYFDVRRTEEDLYPNEKFGDRPWYGLIGIEAKFINGKLASNPDVILYGGGNYPKTDFSINMKPGKPWTWEMVGGANLWSKAANPPN